MIDVLILFIEVLVMIDFVLSFIDVVCPLTVVDKFSKFEAIA